MVEADSKSRTQDEKDDQPIRTPMPETDKHWLEPGLYPPINPVNKFSLALFELVRKPADWIRTNVVEPNRGPKYYWYHRRFPRVLPIDECYMDDEACIYEADLEYQRIKKVDKATVEMLRLRRDACFYYYKNDKGVNLTISDKCKDLVDTYKREELNYFIKYGELEFRSNIVQAYMKQKHRMIMERRQELKKKANEAKADGN